MAGVKRGEIWLYAFKSPVKRRPVLVLSRAEVIGLLDTVIVVPITSAVRGSPGEVVLGIDEGLKTRSAANLDHVQTVRQSALTHYVGSVSREKMMAVCRALAVATGCAAA